jgi:hypothetical protein
VITGAGKNGGLGQALALGAGLNGAASVGVHFHRSYLDGFDLVDRLQAEGVEAFPVQADVTNMGDLWATRSYVIEQMGVPPDLVVCNSGLTEKGYSFGGALREVEVEPLAVRRARSASTSSTTSKSRAGARHQDRRLPGHDTAMGRRGRVPQPDDPDRLHLVAPGARPWPQRPRVHHRQLRGRGAARGSAGQSGQVGRSGVGAVDLLSVHPHRHDRRVRRQPEGFGRWQPRMLEPYEAAESFLDLLARPAEQTAGGIYELLVDGTPQALDISWRRVRLEAQPQDL